MPRQADPFLEFYTGVGANVRHYRQRKGFTMEQLGEDIGAHKAAISRIEKGCNFTLQTLFKIAAALDVKPDDLLRMDEFQVSDYDLDRYVAVKKQVRKYVRKKP